MRLTDEETAMRAGAAGPEWRWAIEQRIKIGAYLGAMVEVDPESDPPVLRVLPA